MALDSGLNLYLVGARCKMLNIIMNVMIVIMIIGLVGRIIIGGIMSFIPNSSFAHVGLQLNIGRHLNIHLRNNKFLEVAQVRTLILAIASSMIPIIITTIVIVKMIRDLLITMECGKSFDEKNSKRLMVIGVTVIIGSFFESLSYIIIYNLVLPMISLLRLENINFTINALDGSTILLGIIIILISGIFKYGCYLQNEYDETV